MLVRLAADRLPALVTAPDEGQRGHATHDLLPHDVLPERCVPPPIDVAELAAGTIKVALTEKSVQIVEDRTKRSPAGATQMDAILGVGETLSTHRRGDAPEITVNGLNEVVEVVLAQPTVQLLDVHLGLGEGVALGRRADESKKVLLNDERR